MSNFAWVTLTTNDTYSLGALVLAHSLKRSGTAHQLAVLITPGVSEAMRNKLKDVYNVVQEVNVMDSQDAANLALLARPELGITFTKLHCWRLVQFEKCVFLDSDTLVLQNCDELFEREELSAAPDVSWPDCFNSGVFVFKPDLDTFAKITEFALKNGSFDGGDQGLLNSYFADWAHADIKKHLPFIYNVAAYASYCYLPAFKQFRDRIKILHFAGKMKPWLIQFNSQSKVASTPSDYGHAADMIQLWWNIFCDNVHQKLTDSMIFWPTSTVVQWVYFHQIHMHENSNYQENHNENEQQQQEHYNEYQQQELGHQHHYGHQQYDDYFIDEIKEYRDPWEDYYKHLEEEEEIARQQQIERLKVEVEEEKEYVEVIEETKIYEEFYVEDVHISCPQEDVQKFIEIQENSEQKNTQEAPSCDTKDTNLSTKTKETYEEIHSTQNNTADDMKVRRPEQQTEEEETIEIRNFHNNDDENKENEAGLAGALAQLRLGEQRTPEQEAYEQLMRRQCWESGQIDYSGKDSFDNIWKQITQTLATKPSSAPKDNEPSGQLHSSEIEDGKTEYDPVTKAKTTYKLIDGGYEVHIKTPEPNGTIKTEKKTFWDPKPVSEEDMLKEQENRKLVKSRMNKEIRIDKNTTMLTRAIEGGYEEVYTTVNEDGTKSMRTKTFFDSVPAEINEQTQKTVQKKDKSGRNVDSTENTQSRKVVQQKNLTQNAENQQSNFNQQSTMEETRRFTQNIEITENNRTVRRDSLQQEHNTRAITSSNFNDDKDAKKKTTKRIKSNIPKPPPGLIDEGATDLIARRVPGGVEYIYNMQHESGKTVTISKTVFEEEEVELTEEETKAYQKTLKDAEKHKNLTTTKKLKSDVGVKKVLPSENGEVTTVEIVKIEGGTEHHYTTVCADGTVKRATKVVYDPILTTATEEEEEEEEIIEEIQEEIITPGEKNIRTYETTHKLPQRFEEQVTITHEKKEKKVKKSMMISQ